MRCHKSLSSTSLRMSTVFVCPRHRTTPFKLFSLCFLLALFPSILAVVARCSKLCLLITFPVNRACCVLILLIRVAFLLASINTLSLVRLAFQLESALYTLIGRFVFFEKTTFPLPKILFSTPLLVPMFSTHKIEYT